MAILLGKAQIDAALTQVGAGLQRYLWLQARVAEAADFHRDPEFRRRFNRFYRVRRGPTWQETFYKLMASAHRRGLQFPEVLRALHEGTSQYEASYASKLVATLDPSQPVIDDFVLKERGPAAASACGS